MNFLWHSILKDLRRRLADPLAILLWVGIPTLIGGLMGLIGGGPDSSPTAQLLVVDEDESFVSELLVKAADGTPVVEVTLFESVAEGRKEINAGNGSALLLIPAGFGQAVFERTPTELGLVKNPAQRILPGIIEEALEMLVEGSFYVQRLFADELDLLTDGPLDGSNFFDNVEIARLSIGINDRMQRLETTLFPPVLEIVAGKEEPKKESSGFNLGRAMFPGVLFMSLLFIAMGISDDLWQERTAGTLRRMRSAPAGMWVFLSSKVITGSLIVGGIAAMGLSAGAMFWELPLGRLPLALLWTVYGGAVLLMLFFLVQSLASNQRGGNVLSTMLVFPLMMVGGSFFPYEAMPAWMVRAGSWTPNGQAVLRLKNILGMGEIDYAALANATAMLAAVGLISALLCSLRLRKED